MDFSCKCPLRPGMTYDEILNEIYIGPLNPDTGHHESKNCCAHRHYICSNLDKMMRIADTERQRRKMYTKRLERQGLTKEEIAKMPIRKRASRNRVVDRGQTVDLKFDD